MELTRAQLELLEEIVSEWFDLREESMTQVEWAEVKTLQDVISTELETA